MKPRPGTIDNKLSIYILVAVISGLLFYYYFGYVPQNETRLNDHAIRIIDNKSQSILEKYKGYANAINSAPLSYFLHWYFTIHKSEDTILISNGKEDFLFSTEGRHLETPRKVSKKSFHDSSRVDPTLTPHENGSEDSWIKNVWREKNGNCFFVYQPLAKFIELRGNVRDTISPYLWVNTSGFTSNLKSNDFFEDLFLVRDNQNENEINKEDKEIGALDDHILDQSSLGLVQFKIPDSLRQTGEGIFNQIILGQSYRVYFKLIKLRRGLNVFVVALVSTHRFEREARQVPIWFLIFCVLGALILIFVFPLLKLFFLNEHERLAARDVTMAVFSIILCVSLATILLTGGYLFWGAERERTDKKLTDLSTRISEATNTEVDSMVTSISFPALFSDRDAKTLFKKRNATVIFNEVFSLDIETGSIKTIFIHPDSPIINSVSFPIKVAERNYFKKVKENPDKIDFYIEAITSFASGRTEAAVSIPYGDKSSPKNCVRVVTSPLASLNHATIPEPFKFLVIDRAGDIKFHSDWDQLRSENFVRECNDAPLIKSYIENGIDDFVNFDYLRKNCRGYFTPIARDWYLITYHESADTRDLAAQVFTLCLITLAMIIFYCAALHFILRADRAPISILKTKPFFYNWLGPLSRGKAFWFSLFRINLLLFLIELIALYVFTSIIETLIFVLLVITVSFFINHKKLVRHGEKMKEAWSGFYLKSLIGFWAILLVFVQIYLRASTNVVGGMTLLAIVLLTAFFNSRLFDAKMVFKKWRPTRYNSYRLFLVSWMSIITIGPSLLFIFQHYAHENLIRNYAFLLEDVKNRQIKSVDENSKLTGSDYVGIKIDSVFADSSKSYPNLDMQFYKRLPRYVVSNNKNGGLLFNHLPSYKKYRLEQDSVNIHISSVSSFYLKKDFLKAERPLHSSAFIFNESVVLIILIAVLLSRLLWWSMVQIPRKVFYAPVALLLKDFKGKRILNDIFHREFEFVENSGHPLHRLAEPEREKILKEYDHAKAGVAKVNRYLLYETYILKLQKTANWQYEQAWYQCSEEEKFFLYDLAEDGVVNQYNSALTDKLFEKGLVRVCPELKVINVSFANFVRESLNAEALTKLEIRESSGGRWKHIRIILVIMVLAAFAFLSIAEEGFIGRITALIGSVTLLLPNLITMFGSLTRIFTKGGAQVPAAS
jgi:hypothetical protein